MNAGLYIYQPKQLEVGRWHACPRFGGTIGTSVETFAKKGGHCVYPVVEAEMWHTSKSKIYFVSENYYI